MGVDKSVYSAMLVARSAGVLFLVLYLPIMFGLVGMLLAHSMMPQSGAWTAIVGIGSLVAWTAYWLFDALSFVSVGQDGVLIRRRLRPHFVAFSDIADAVEVDGIVIRLVLRSGECLDVYTGKDGATGKEKYVERCDGVLARIKEGVERTRARGDGEEAAAEAVLDRAQVLLREEQHADKVPYRSRPALETDDLWGVVEDNGATPTQRAAAAVLLHRSDDADTHKRLRIASKGTLEPKLKKLLRIAAQDDSDEEALRDALAAMEQQAEASATAQRG